MTNAAHKTTHMGQGIMDDRMNIESSGIVTLSQPGVVSLAIKEKSALYAAYMPYIKGGGLFIPSRKNYKIGDEVFMLLSLMDEATKLKVVGHVVWIAPVSNNNRPQGIGIQFSEKDGGLDARNKIDAILGGLLKSPRATHTM